MFDLSKKLLLISLFLSTLLNGCAGLPGADARKNPPNPDERVKKNLEEGKGFRLDSVMKGNRGGDFEFASSNELWRASLDIIDFMPLVSANYSGGIIITDWYSENNDESIKITLRFLSNEIRSDAIEIKKEILKKAAIYEKQNKDKNFKPYSVTDLKD